MPGPYAHITLLHELMRPALFESLCSSMSTLPDGLKKNFGYCALGAVSPDYPNLAVDDGQAAVWADAMHYTRTGDMIKSGIRMVAACSGDQQTKLLAWLLGYVAHVVTDVTIHPVVQAKVGVYADNQRQHRMCEMHQDSYIFHRMGRGEIGESDYFAMAVAGCSRTGDREQLDKDIADLWSDMLAEVHPELYAAHRPDITGWHREFVIRVQQGATSELRLFPLAEIIATKMALSYPRHDAVQPHYVEDLVIPRIIPVIHHYGDIFDRAISNVAALWNLVYWGVCEGDTTYADYTGNWDLDTGRDEQGRLVFWE